METIIKQLKEVDKRLSTTRKEIAGLSGFQSKLRELIFEAERQAQRVQDAVNICTLSNFPELHAWSELDLLTGTIYGEARGETREGKIGVALVINNRVTRPGHWNWGHNWREVVLSRDQFSCWNDSKEKILNAKKECGEVWQECRSIAIAVYLGLMKDNVGATHYHALNVSPNWADKITYLCTIGNHKFYKC